MHYLFYYFFQNNEHHFWQNIKIHKKVVPVFLSSLFHCSKPPLYKYSLLQENQMYPWSLGMLCVIQNHPFLADTWSFIQALLARRMVTVIWGLWERRKENEGRIKDFHKPLLIFKVSQKWHTYTSFGYCPFFFPPLWNFLRLSNVARIFNLCFGSKEIPLLG